MATVCSSGQFQNELNPLENSQIRNASREIEAQLVATRLFSFVVRAPDLLDFGAEVTRVPNPIAIAVSLG